MEKTKVVMFKSYPFEVGQKIYIDSGPRKGDWVVIGVSERKVKFRCPLSAREFEWNRFCYFTEERSDEQWPHKD